MPRQKIITVEERERFRSLLDDLRRLPFQEVEHYAMCFLEGEYARKKRAGVKPSSLFKDGQEIV